MCEVAQTPMERREWRKWQYWRRLGPVPKLKLAVLRGTGRELGLGTETGDSVTYEPLTQRKWFIRVRLPSSWSGPLGHDDFIYEPELHRPCLFAVRRTEGEAFRRICMDEGAWWLIVAGGLGEIADTLKQMKRGLSPPWRMDVSARDVEFVRYDLNTLDHLLTVAVWAHETGEEEREVGFPDTDGMAHLLENVATIEGLLPVVPWVRSVCGTIGSDIADIRRLLPQIRALTETVHERFGWAAGLDVMANADEVLRRKEAVKARLNFPKRPPPPPARSGTRRTTEYDRAKQLHAQGMHPKAIAHRIGASLRTVYRWREGW